MYSLKLCTHALLLEYIVIAYVEKVISFHRSKFIQYSTFVKPKAKTNKELQHNDFFLYLNNRCYLDHCAVHHLGL